MEPTYRPTSQPSSRPTSQPTSRPTSRPSPIPRFLGASKWDVEVYGSLGLAALFVLLFLRHYYNGKRIKRSKSDRDEEEEDDDDDISLIRGSGNNFTMFLI
jgi:hypothetical protein